MINYDSLPFIDIAKHSVVSEKNKQELYNSNPHLMTEHRIDLIENFLTGHFEIAGEVKIIPEFIASQYARQHLIYPVAFLLLEANADYFTTRDSLPMYELRYTLEGEGLLQYDGKTYVLKKGDGYLIDCRLHHHYQTRNTSWKSTVFHFNGIPVAPYFEALRKQKNVKFSDTYIPNFEMLQNQILQKTMKPAPYLEYKLSCLFHLLLTEILTAEYYVPLEEERPDIIQTVISYLNEHYDDDISIGQLLHKFGISRTHLDREFRKYTGFSPREYLIQVRINHAKLLLQGSNYSVEQISGIVGFNNTAHFVQMFKKHTDLTPLKFRKLHKLF